MSRPADRELGWRQSILARFSAEAAAVSRLTIASDPDGLLAEPGVIEEIRARGFELVPFEDHVAFRFAYESRFRNHWDRGESAPLVVVLRTTSSELGEIPHDLLEEARGHSRLLSFSLADIFPKLSPHVVGELDRSDLDALFRAQESQGSDVLGENGTRDFILRHVFSIAPEMIRSTSDLLQVLLRRHHRPRACPSSLDERLQDVLQRSGNWGGWPLERILPDRAAFLAFLQERWHWFLIDRGLDPIPGREPRTPTIPGPRVLPFDHDDVRVYVESMFIEGILSPTAAVSKAGIEEPWMAVGVLGDATSDARERLTLLLGQIREKLPGPGARHREWQETALRWAEAIGLRWRLEGADAADVRADHEDVHDALEQGFAAWMLEHYGSLPNLAPLPGPVTVDKIVSFLAHDRRRSGDREARTALLVVDGLALDQWFLFRDDIREHVAATLDEMTSFAWVPTLTAVSRQAIFAGVPPFMFPGSISTTQKDPKHWTRAWENQGLRAPEVQFVLQRKQEEEHGFAERIREAAEQPDCRVLGIVVGTIDRMMHGNVTGMGGMHAEIRHWLGQGSFRTLLEVLLEERFDVFLTSDHGNIEGIGIGKPSVGAIADERGERAHVFPDEQSRDHVREGQEGALAWPGTGLPDSYHVLLAPGRGAFVAEGARTVAHGGISLEEVIVPFIRIRGAG